MKLFATTFTPLLTVLNVLAEAGRPDDRQLGLGMAAGSDIDVVFSGLLQDLYLTHYQLRSPQPVSQGEDSPYPVTERYKTIPASDLHSRQIRSHEATDSSTPSFFNNLDITGHPIPRDFHLCDHPPLVYSQSFLGSYKESCSTPFSVPAFETANYLCNYTLSILYPNQSYTDIHAQQSHIKFIKLFYDEVYVQVCLPLFRLYHWCEDFEWVVICWSAPTIIFVNPQICPSSHLSEVSRMLFGMNILEAILLDYYDGVKRFCTGICRVEVKEIAGLEVVLYNMDMVIHGKRCTVTNRKPTLQNFDGEQIFNTDPFRNLHWPTCSPFHTVMWSEDPTLHGLNPAWDYLSSSCQIVEVVLIVWVGCVAIGGLVGNLLVLVVMVAGGHRGQESNILRTSMAFADLFTVLFVVIPSFYYHILPFISTIEFDKYVASLNDYTNDSGLITPGQIAIHSGFSVVQGLVFSTASFVSLLTLAFLSFERLIITTKPLQYNKIFSVPKIILLITFTWIDGIIGTITMSSHPTGLGVVYFTNVKISSGMSKHFASTTAQVFYYIHIAFFALTTVGTIILSIVSIRNFLVEQARVAAEWKSLKMRVVGSRLKQENRYILTTQLLMTFCFLLSLLPRSFIFMWRITNQPRFAHEYFDLLHYISWWLFLGGTAWNPWVYNMRSHQFRKDTASTMRRLLKIFS